MQIANAGFPWDCAPLLMDRIISQPATRRSAPTTILAGTDCVIIAGHGRLLAARKLGMTEVPVIVLEGLTENQRRALVLADNKLALNAGWDEDALRLEIEALQDADYDGQNGAFTIHANPPEERQPTVHGFRERLRNFAFRVAAGLVRAGKLRYCVPVGDHVSAVWPIFANKCRCCVNQKGDENLEVENVWLLR